MSSSVLGREQVVAMVPKYIPVVSAVRKKCCHPKERRSIRARDTEGLKVAGFFPRFVQDSMGNGRSSQIGAKSQVGRPRGGTKSSR